MRISIFILSISLSFIIVKVNAQNHHCETAYYIDNADDYCSPVGLFTNAGSPVSAQNRPFCWPDMNHDVWFAFAPTKPGVFIQLTGQNGSNAGTLLQPQIAVYDKPCNQIGIDDHIACNSDLYNYNLIEITLTDLIIGKIYYIRVDGRGGNTGTFRLCLSSFNPTKVPESDCPKGVVLCDKSPFVVQNLTSIGDLKNEVDGTCVQEEFASVWYRWTCKDPGTLTFTVSPTNEGDDLDFVVFRLPGGINDCKDKQWVRCMAAGETIGQSPQYNAPCKGPTGLSLTATDVVEMPGCGGGNNNYIAALNMQAGESYALMVNNYSKSGAGFEIEFGGTGTFEGPETDFIAEAVDAFECDKTIVFTDNSSSSTDPIVNYLWNFGVGASPLSSNSFLPIPVIYESFGWKTVALTVESSRGCLVTEIKDIYINPCCQDTSTLWVEAGATDLNCFGIPDGTISATGFSGAPAYAYSLDSIHFRPIPYFSGLWPGDYTVYIQDIKGCSNKDFVSIDQPPPIFAYAPPDTVITLGYTIQLQGTYISNNPVQFLWTTQNGRFITESNAQQVVVQPIKDGYYYFTITEDAGCTHTDSVYIRVIKERPVYAPNVFTPNNDGLNDKFSLKGGPAAELIDELKIFDRWGELMWEGNGLVFNDNRNGWDGKFKEVWVNPGVYVWAAKVRFIDGEIIPYSGDITVVR